RARKGKRKHVGRGLQTCEARSSARAVRRELQRLFEPRARFGDHSDFCAKFAEPFVERGIAGQTGSAQRLMFAAYCLLSKVDLACAVKMDPCSVMTSEPLEHLTKSKMCLATFRQKGHRSFERGNRALGLAGRLFDSSPEQPPLRRVARTLGNRIED